MFGTTVIVPRRASIALMMATSAALTGHAIAEALPERDDGAVHVLDLGRLGLAAGPAASTRSCAARPNTSAMVGTKSMSKVTPSAARHRRHSSIDQLLDRIEPRVGDAADLRR